MDLRIPTVLRNRYHYDRWCRRKTVPVDDLCRNRTIAEANLGGDFNFCGMGVYQDLLLPDYHGREGVRAKHQG
jgi:hypothetical protein